MGRRSRKVSRKKRVGKRVGKKVGRKVEREEMLKMGIVVFRSF